MQNLKIRVSIERVLKRMFYHILDPIELGPFEGGLYPISDGQDVNLLNFYQSKACDDYQHFCQQRMQ